MGSIKNFLLFLFIPRLLVPFACAEEKIVTTDKAAEISLDGKLFTRYVFAGAPKPFFYPVIGPTGKAVTRAYPMEKVAGESSDHPHQRSIWFTHGAVNGVDFWSETPAAGKQVQRTLMPGKDGHISVCDWFTVDNKKICEDTRTFRFFSSPSTRGMDVVWQIKASEGALTFGDTKEGSFGIRLADTMKVKGGGGHIENSRGEKDGDTWGKRAEWVDYYGPVEGETLGIAIFDHPKNFRHPTYWHVRDYGLFAVNPFGIHDFDVEYVKDANGKEKIVRRQPKGAGDYTVPAGETLTLRYRILVHKGDTASAKIADAWKEYSAK